MNPATCLRLALLLACSLCITPATSSAQSRDAYVRDSSGTIVRNSNVGDPRIGNLCVRTGYWTPAQAIAECDDIAPRPPEPKRLEPAPLHPPIYPKPRPEPVKVTYAADVFFDFDKTVIKPDAKVKLDDLVAKLQQVNLEVMIAIGHADAIGSDAYNDKLSVRRAEAVKAYLVSKGIEANRVYVEGKGKRLPRADNRSAEGRAQNRRVEIETVGTPK